MSDQSSEKNLHYKDTEESDGSEKNSGKSEETEMHFREKDSNKNFAPSEINSNAATSVAVNTEESIENHYKDGECLEKGEEKEGRSRSSSTSSISSSTRRSREGLTLDFGNLNRRRRSSSGSEPWDNNFSPEPRPPTSDPTVGMEEEYKADGSSDQRNTEVEYCAVGSSDQRGTEVEYNADGSSDQRGTEVQYCAVGSSDQIGTEVEYCAFGSSDQIGTEVEYNADNSSDQRGTEVEYCADGSSDQRGYTEGEYGAVGITQDSQPSLESTETSSNERQEWASLINPGVESSWGTASRHRRENRERLGRPPTPPSHYDSIFTEPFNPSDLRTPASVPELPTEFYNEIYTTYINQLRERIRDEPISLAYSEWLIIYEFLQICQDHFRSTNYRCLGEEDWNRMNGFRRKYAEYLAWKLKEHAKRHPESPLQLRLKGILKSPERAQRVEPPTSPRSAVAWSDPLERIKVFSGVCSTSTVGAGSLESPPEIPQDIVMNSEDEAQPECDQMFSQDRGSPIVEIEDDLQSFTRWQEEQRVHLDPNHFSAYRGDPTRLGTLQQDSSSNPIFKTVFETYAQSRTSCQTYSETQGILFPYTPLLHQESQGILSPDGQIHQTYSENQGILSQDAPIHQEIQGILSTDTPIQQTYSENKGILSQDPSIHQENLGILSPDTPIHQEIQGILSPVTPILHQESQGILAPDIPILHQESQVILSPDTPILHQGSQGIISPNTPILHQESQEEGAVGPSVTEIPISPPKHGRNTSPEVEHSTTPYDMPTPLYPYK